MAGSPQALDFVHRPTAWPSKEQHHSASTGRPGAANLWLAPTQHRLRAPPPEAIGESRYLITNSYTAPVGMAGGAAINVVVKSRHEHLPGHWLGVCHRRRLA